MRQNGRESNTKSAAATATQVSRVPTSPRALTLVRDDEGRAGSGDRQLALRRDQLGGIDRGPRAKAGGDHA